MQRTMGAAAAFAAMTWAAGAAADSPTLKGDYGFTGTAGCLFSAPQAGPGPGGGFNDRLQPNQGSRFFRLTFSV